MSITNSSPKFHELSKTNISCTNQFVFRVAWSGSTLVIMTDRGIELFDLACNISSYSKDVELASSSLACPRALAPPRPVDQPSVVTSYAWSPPDFINNFGSVLAVISSHGSVALFARRRVIWDMLLDLSTLLVKSVRGKKTIELRERIMETESSSICWGSLIQPHSCIFLTAQRTGNILFWEVMYEEANNELKADMLHVLETDIGEIKTMTWLPKSHGKFSLVCSSMNGVIKMYDGRIQDQKFFFKENACFLWLYRDLMVLNHIDWFMNKSNFVLVCSKNRHLLVFLISPNNELLSQYINNINDFTITGCTKTKNNDLYVVSNCDIFKVNITVERNELNIAINNVSFKDNYSDFIFLDIASSYNDAIFAVSLVKKPMAKREMVSVTIVFLKFEDYNSLEILLKNPSQKLTHMWDSIELLRIECAKNKRLPIINYDEIFSDPNLSTYNMKLYLILSKLHCNYALFNMIAPKTIFDSLSHDTIRDTLFVRHAVNLVDALHALYLNSSRQLKMFQRQTFLACCHYIETYCNKYMNNLTSYITEEALNLAKAEDPEYSYKCINCENNLVDWKCNCGHPNQFCTVSLQPIREDDYLLCSHCGSTACLEFYSEKPLCIFCDVYLEKYFFD